MMFHKIIFSGLLISFSLVSVAQTKKANKLFDTYQYSRALPFLEKAFNKKEDATIAIKIAQCHIKNHDSKQAEVWYAKSLAISKFEYSYSYLEYGQTLKNNGKYDLAKEQFETFNELQPNDKRGELYAQSCVTVKNWLEETDKFKVANVSSINTKGTEFNPVYYKDGLVYTSNMRLNLQENYVYGWTGSQFLNLVYSVKDSSDLKYFSAKGFDKNINHDYHDGPVSFAQNDTLMVFTKVFKEREGKEFVNRKKLFFSKRVGEKWQKPTPFYLNSNEYSVDHPSFTKNGDTLYFASDMAGGYGQSDIYYCTKNDTGWSKPVNLGASVNTFANEMFPYIHSSGILYFSSNGHIGYGGLDIFSATKNNDAYSINNLRSPLNSSADDFGIILNKDKTQGYFSSNRIEGKGEDDIYFFNPADIVEQPVVCKEVIKEHQCIDLDISGDIDDNLVYQWGMGDGNTATGSKLTYCYNYPGNFTVSLNTINKKTGRIKYNEQSLEIDVSNEHNAIIACKDSFLLNEILNLDGTKSKIEGYDIETYNWLFNDENIKGGATANSIVTVPGKHKVSLELMAKKNNRDTTVCSYKYIYVKNITIRTGDDFATTLVNTPIDIDILGNDYLVQNKKYSEEITTSTKHGELVKNSDGNYKYTPNEKFVGKDTALYTINYLDNSGSSSARLLINIVDETTQLNTADLVSQKNDNHAFGNYTYELNVKDARSGESLDSTIAFIYNNETGELTEQLLLSGSESLNLKANNSYVVKFVKKGYLVGCAEFNKLNNINDVMKEDIKLTSAQFNSPIKIENIYYDFDKYYIRKDAKKPLNNLATILKNNPQYKVELASHTDSRASHGYNEWLSRMRAHAAIKYLKSKGVQKSRMVAAGYGETRLINKCADGVKCSVSEHQANRRTEFTILGYVDEKAKNTSFDDVLDQVRSSFKNGGVRCE